MNNKPWAKDETAILLGYNSVTVTHHLDNFIAYCNNIKGLPFLKILDLGCGNGRVVLSLNDNLSKDFHYTGLDINKVCVNSGNNQIMARNRCSFKLYYCDVDESRIKDKFDVCLIDSALSMMERPMSVLENVQEYCDRIYISRIHLANKTSNVGHNWGTGQGIMWVFSDKDFHYSDFRTTIEPSLHVGLFDVIMEK